LGDFNVFWELSEKRDRQLPPNISFSDFTTWRNANLLTHFDIVGIHLTWRNGSLNSDNVALRLERAICNEVWINCWHVSSCTTLVQNHSDHHPILVTLLRMPRPLVVFFFKFLKAWTSHDDCRRLVLEIWNKLVVASGMHRLQLKLQRVKEAFKLWNKFVFGDIHRRVHLACDEVNHIQLLIDLNGLTHDLYAQELQAHLVLTKAMNFHDQFWREKARNQSFILVIVILPIFT